MMKNKFFILSLVIVFCLSITPFAFTKDTSFLSAERIMQALADMLNSSGKFTSIDFADDTSQSTAAGAGSGSVHTIKENDVGVGGADITILDFLGADFNLAESPDTEIQVVIEDGGIDHDSTANFAAGEHFTQAAITTVGTVTTGTWQGDIIAHEYGGLEISIAAIGIGDVIAGDSAGVVAIIDGGAAADGDVLTIQADGKVLFEAQSGGGNVSDNTAEAVTGVWEIQDDTKFVFGNDANYSIQYDETGGADQLLIETTATAATATTDPMIQILVGTTPTADQQVFGIAKGTQASNTDLLTLDEDGDMAIPGAMTALSYNVSAADGSHLIGASNTTGFTGSGEVEGDINYDATANRWELYDGTDWNDYIPSAELPTVGWTGDHSFKDIIAEGTVDLGTAEAFLITDTTPDVSSGAYFTTHDSTQTLTDFDGAGIAAGQIITVFTVLTSGSVTFDVTASGLKGGTTDIVTVDEDVTKWMYDGTDWYLIAFSNASDDMGTDGGGGAAADTLVVFTPLSNEPPASNFATPDLRNSHPVLDFDATTNESSVFSGVMPRRYGGGGVTVYIHYAMTSATSGNIDWDVAFERIGDQQQDLDADGFAAVNSVDNTTVPGTTGLVDIVSITFTDGADMDSVAAGESFRLQVTKDAVSDTAAGDGELVKVEVKET